MGKVKKVTEEIYGMFCGDDGKLSHRRVMASITFYVIMKLSLSVGNGATVPEFLFMNLIALFLILLGIVAGQSLVKSFLDRGVSKTTTKQEKTINEQSKED